MIKRIVDIAIAAVGLIILSPVLLGVAVAVRLTSRGSVFYRQMRIGQYGSPFVIWKYRTMCINADSVGPSITKRDDSRITSLGRFLREWKIDELPQLFNVLAGTMSLVGPRPEVARYVALYSADQKRVLELKPGITDLASLHFRDEEQMLAAAADPEQFYCEYCMPRKIELNLQYAAKAGIYSDIKLIIATLVAVVKRKPSR